jgi:hypothetical protein
VAFRCDVFVNDGIKFSFAAFCDEAVCKLSEKYTSFLGEGAFFENKIHKLKIHGKFSFEYYM